MEKKDINYIIEAHTKHPVKSEKAFRKWDGKTPYYVHPLWCATTIAAETALDEQTRNEGLQTLLYHDILEDTTQELPDWLSDRVKWLVQQMTFEGGNEQEMREIWEKTKEVQLYKLYDKVNNFLDANHWMPPQKIDKYRTYIGKLTENVLSNYGELNITKMARELIKK